MDKEKATKLLVEQLVKAHGQTFVTDTAHKKHLLEKAVAYYPIEYEKPFTLDFRIQFLNDNRYTISGSKLDELINNYKEKLIEHCSVISEVNYVFVENSQSFNVSGKYSDVSSMSLMGNLSFFALIGEKEIKNLQRMFYKDVDLDIIRAMKSLKIKNFIDVYKSYKKDSYFARNIRSSDGFEDFFEFVFTIPYEDQNISANTNILHEYPYRIDFVEILTQEYSDGKYFKEYFNCMDKTYKMTVFDSLKNIRERNPINDSFLWANGFKEVKLDHIELYKTDTLKFVDYFKNRNLEEKKMILKDLMNYDFTNEGVIKWLNENHLDLIREVGFNG